MTSREMRFSLLVALSVCFIGCRDKAKNTEKGVTSAGTSASAASYAPPAQGVGTVEGTVVIEGDPPLVIDAQVQRIPADCDAARTMYPPMFREGPGRTLADVFVGVTGYHGQSKPKTAPLSVEAKGCAFPSRTFGLTKDQHFEVRSGDERSYVPSLFGARSKATLVAVPNGTAVPVFHRGPGQYVLVNDMQIFTQAAVLVVDYSTFDVTGLDGKFRIEGVPAGDAEVSAYLPSAKLTTSQKLKVLRGETTRVTLKLRFDAAAAKSVRNSTNSGTTPATLSSVNVGSP